MGIFTTNWYLYKTHLPSFSVKSQARSSEIKSKDYRSKKEEIQVRKLCSKKRMSFEALLGEAIDEGLAMIGETSKEEIHHYLEEAFAINRKEIPYRIEEFANAIERVFGNGAKILEIQIMKCLFKRVGYSFKNYQNLIDLNFTEYVAAAKNAQNNYEKIGEEQLNRDSKQNRKKLICVRIV